jgi:uncharacterized protein (DUF4213/DUF364 family)
MITKPSWFTHSTSCGRAGKSAVSQTGAPDEDPAILKAQIEERDRMIAELDEKLLSGDEVHRVLHNRIQELRGTVRVYVHARPFLPTDGAVAQHSSIDILPNGESLISSASTLVRITLSSSTRYSHPRLLIEEDFTV